MDDRSRQLLKTLIERYIAEGQPVGSRSLSKFSGLDLSPATIRNVMADLEELGLVASPHTSAGRVPTPKGYRLFVDSLLTVQPIDPTQEQSISGQLQADAQVRLFRMPQAFSQVFPVLLGWSVRPVGQGLFAILNFCDLAIDVFFLILVTPDGDVVNKVFHVDQDYLPEALVHAGNYLTAHYAGLSLTDVRSRLHREIADLRQDVSRLMLKAVEEGGAALSDPDGAIVISGERRLLDVTELSEDMGRLRQLFDLFEKKTSLAKLLEFSERAQGVKIYIGGESNLVPVDELSVITAPYQVNGRIVGTLGVIGPTRMAYDRVIPIVDITARLVSTALTHLAAESGPQTNPSGAGA